MRPSGSCRLVYIQPASQHALPLLSGQFRAGGCTVYTNSYQHSAVYPHYILDISYAFCAAGSAAAHSPSNNLKHIRLLFQSCLSAASYFYEYPLCLALVCQCSVAETRSIKAYLILQRQTQSHNIRPGCNIVCCISYSYPEMLLLLWHSFLSRVNTLITTMTIAVWC